MASVAAESGDDGTNDLIVSDIIRTTNCRSGSSPNTSSRCLWVQAV